MSIQMKFARLKNADCNHEAVEKHCHVPVSYRRTCLAVAPLVLASITACDAFSTNTTSQDEIRVEPKVLRAPDLEKLPQPGSGDSVEGMVEVKAAYKPENEQYQEGRVAISGSNEIPYPIYPDAKQYRIGGENGLHVVLFETNDSFEEVDSFYKRYGGSQGYARLVGMPDYVRYDVTREATGSTTDAWNNTKPGIVIHGFSSSDEAAESGATPGAKTNIIVSY